MIWEMFHLVHDEFSMNVLFVSSMRWEGGLIAYFNVPCHYNFDAPAWISDATRTDCNFVPFDFQEIISISAVLLHILFHLWICDSNCTDLLAVSPIHG